MRVCVMTAVTNSGNGHNNFLGVVVGKTKEEAARRAKKKWSWYGSKNFAIRYYAGHPIVTTRWHKI